MDIGFKKPFLKSIANQRNLRFALCAGQAFVGRHASAPPFCNSGPLTALARIAEFSSLNCMAVAKAKCVTVYAPRPYILTALRCVRQGASFLFTYNPYFVLVKYGCRAHIDYSILDHLTKHTDCTIHQQNESVPSGTQNDQIGTQDC